MIPIGWAAQALASFARSVSQRGVKTIKIEGPMSGRFAPQAAVRSTPIPEATGSNSLLAE
jgi:hypothetical protein